MALPIPVPMLVGAQYTYVLQDQTQLVSPYAGKLSLNPEGDRQPSHTLGVYAGWAPTEWTQLYCDVEKFMGAGVSNATGLGGLTNGDVVREGAAGLRKTPYVARAFARFLLPLGGGTAAVERAQDQLPGQEPTTRLELKIGRMAVSDDFDRNRYAGSTRTEFMNWSLWDNTAWDYAANTRGYTDGLVLGFVAPTWSIKYGVYRMPRHANGQELVQSLSTARGENLELTVRAPTATIVRLLAYRNTAGMGDYREELAIAAAAGAIPDIAADDRPGRHKYGFGLNAEQPVADDGETGAFIRLGWNDGKTESFAFTEVDRLVSFGGQLSGVHWRRAEDHFAAAVAIEGLSRPHQDYLAAGGSGFVLGDGHLRYGREQILEMYYQAQYTWQATSQSPVRLQFSPDFQLIHNPGYNQDRGPVRFWGLRLHLEY